jgi:TonB-dependent starch-binding outer membrane protein SusC
MKKINILQSLNWHKIMRISLIQFIALFLVVGFTYANPTNAQAILDKEVTIKADNVSLKDAIEHIQGQVQVKFVYSSRIKLSNKVSLNAEKTKLSTVLDKLLTPSKIGYRVINEQIVLTTTKSAEEPSHGSVEELLEAEAFDMTVTGTVTDETRDVLPGASIFVKGTTTGALTDINGKYSVKVADNKAVLVFSYTGYLSKEVVVGDNQKLDVVLQTNANTIEETVVIAYGTSKKANLTGAVATVNMGEIEGIPIPNAATALQGRMAGVTISAFTGQPGKNDPVIRIRGVGSYGINNSPMVIIDGSPSDVAALGDLSTDDIQSISVLKDAASASVYGVRASNGVILVTTKRGTAGKPKIQYRSTVTTQTPLIKPRYMDGVEWATAYNDFLVETGAAPIYTPEMIQKIRDQSDPNNFANTDWFDEVYKPKPQTMQYLSVSGGTETARYMVSVDYLDQKGIMDNTNANRFQVRANLDSKVSDHLNFGVNLRGFKQGINEPIASANQNDEGDNGINRVISGFTRPTVAARYTNGEFGLFDGTELAQIKNPLKSLFEQVNHTDNYRFEGQFFGTLKFLKNFAFTSRLIYIYSTSLNNTFVPAVFNYRPDGTTTAPTTNISSARNSMSLGSQYLIENILNYERTFNRHKIQGLLLQSGQRNTSRNFSGSIRNLPSNDVTVLGASAELPTVGGGASAATLLSYTGRLGYTFDEKYMIELSARSDGSSRLPSAKQFPFFPSVGASWTISSEPFFEKLTKYVEFVKLRASWGRLGNIDIGLYPYAQTYSLNQNYYFNNVLSQGVAINGLANDQIEWEKSSQANIGLNIVFPKNIFRIEADVYQKDNTGILIQLPIPNTLGGLTPPNQNAGAVRNRGVELSVGHGKRIRKFSYDISLNGAINENKIMSTAGRTGWISGATITEVGYPIGSYYGYVAQGLFRTQEEVDAHVKQFGVKPRIGDIKYQDTDGNGDVTTADRVILGNPFPKLAGGGTITLGYAGFSVSAFFQGVAGVNRYYEDNANMGPRSQKLRIWNNRWTTANPEGNLPRWGNTTNNNQYSSFRLQDASYLRLKSLNVGYNIPKSFIQRMRLSEVRINLNAINLLTFTQNKDYDAEKSDNDQRSLDYLNVKSFTAALSVTF